MLLPNIPRDSRTRELPTETRATTRTIDKLAAKNPNRTTSTTNAGSAYATRIEAANTATEIERRLRRGQQREASALCNEKRSSIAQNSTLRTEVAHPARTKQHEAHLNRG